MDSTADPWVDVVFVQDVDGHDIDMRGANPLDIAEYLSQWDYGEETDRAHTMDGRPWGRSDYVETFVIGGVEYVLSWPHSRMWCGLSRRPLDYKDEG